MVVTQRRNTTQRAAILQVLAGTDEFVSAQDLHSALRTSGSTIGLAEMNGTSETLATIMSAADVACPRTGCQAQPLGPEALQSRQPSRRMACRNHRNQRLGSSFAFQGSSSPGRYWKSVV